MPRDSRWYIPWADFLEVVAMIRRADERAGVRWWEDEDDEDETDDSGKGPLSK